MAQARTLAQRLADLDLLDELKHATAEAVAYTREHLEDPPAITNWT